MLDVKGIIAILVIAGSFGLLAIYVLRGQSPDPTAVAFVAGPLGVVIGFYFGHINGAATALANNATALASQAINAAAQRRGTDLSQGSIPVAAVVVAAPSPGNSGAPPA